MIVCVLCMVFWHIEVYLSQLVDRKFPLACVCTAEQVSSVSRWPLGDLIGCYRLDSGFVYILYTQWNSLGRSDVIWGMTSPEHCAPGNSIGTQSLSVCK